MALDKAITVIPVSTTTRLFKVTDRSATNIGISGSRDAVAAVRPIVEAKLAEMCQRFGGPIHIMVGDATGIDALTWDIAIDNSIPSTEFVADWKAHGPAAGPIRNKRIIDASQILLAFPMAGKPNKGTNSAITLAKKKGIEVIITEVPDLPGTKFRASK